MEPQHFFDYLRRNRQARKYQTPEGKRFTFKAPDRPGRGCSLWFDVEGMSPRTNRSLSPERIAEWVVFFNSNPHAGSEAYRNLGVKKSRAYNANFFLVLAREARVELAR